MSKMHVYTVDEISKIQKKNWVNTFIMSFLLLLSIAVLETFRVYNGEVWFFESGVARVLEGFAVFFIVVSYAAQFTYGTFDVLGDSQLLEIQEIYKSCPETLEYLKSVNSYNRPLYHFDYAKMHYLKYSAEQAVLKAKMETAKTEVYSVV